MKDQRKRRKAFTTISVLSSEKRLEARFPSAVAASDSFSSSLVSSLNLTMIMNVFLKRGNFFSPSILFKREPRIFFCLRLLQHHRQRKCNPGVAAMFTNGALEDKICYKTRRMLFCQTSLHFLSSNLFLIYALLAFSPSPSSSSSSHQITVRDTSRRNFD